MASMLLIVALLLPCGLGDALGFVYAARGRFAPVTWSKSDAR